MKNWKKTAIMASVLVFICAGVYLNWIYTQDAEAANLDQVVDREKLFSDPALAVAGENLAEAEAGVDLDEINTVTDYFAAVRLSRQQTRDAAITTLQEVMAYGGDGEYSGASGTLEELVDTALCEAQIESLIIAKGYTDCVAYMNGDGISVAVAAPVEGLQASDVALISDVILTQTAVPLENVRVIEVK